MPRLDGTGPQGMGPMTGRGMGPCCVGWGRSFGRRRFASPKNELAALEEEEQMLQEELKALKEEKAALSQSK